MNIIDGKTIVMVVVSKKKQLEFKLVWPNELIKNSKFLAQIQKLITCKEHK